MTWLIDSPSRRCDMLAPRTVARFTGNIGPQVLEVGPGDLPRRDMTIDTGLQRQRVSEYAEVTQLRIRLAILMSKGDLQMTFAILLGPEGDTVFNADGRLVRLLAWDKAHETDCVSTRAKRDMQWELARKLVRDRNG